MEIGQIDGSDSDLPIDRDFHHPLFQLLPTPKADVPRNRIRPLSFSIVTSQNEIAETPTSPDCHAWSISSRALGPNRATPNLIHSMTCVSKTIISDSLDPPHVRDCA